MIVQAVSATSGSLSSSPVAQAVSFFTVSAAGVALAAAGQLAGDTAPARASENSGHRQRASRAWCSWGLHSIGHPSEGRVTFSVKS